MVLMNEGFMYLPLKKTADDQHSKGKHVLRIFISATTLVTKFMITKTNIILKIILQNSFFTSEAIFFRRNKNFK